MRTVTLPSGECVPALGMGTWFLGDHVDTRAEEIAALQCGIDLGLRLIDTAEMYGKGASERLIGSAIKGRRDSVFLVSKVYPHNASRRGTLAACERSLGRLGVDRIDLYLLHWRGRFPLGETVEAFQRLRRDGKIRYWGVSNFDLGDMVELRGTPGGEQVAVNQVLYNLSRRGIEWDLLPWCAEHRIPIMAYSPIEQGRLLLNPALRQLAEASGATPAQLALAWLLRHERVMAIPKASTRAHVEQNVAALNHQLDSRLLAEMDALFPPPMHATPLEML
jgi:diketogulonate reductase-like aldo/keto reductase